MNAEERFITSKVTRRGFVGVSTAGVLAALAGREPQIVRAETRTDTKATGFYGRVVDLL